MIFVCLEAAQMNWFGNNLRISVFGESHGAAVGCTIDGLPAGFIPNLSCVDFELARRAPSRGAESTKRNESNEYEILSGLYNGVCTGSPLTAVFRCTDARGSDYEHIPPRPSHADLAASVKYSGFNDPRGGGMFSGRLTVPIVFAGALCKQLLSKHGIHIASHILRIGSVADSSFDPVMLELPQLDPFFPLIDEEKRTIIEEVFAEKRAAGDSIGGSVECAVLGLPIGLGSPFFNGLESVLSHLLFSIPGVHGVEFGAGFDFASMKGSEANDAILPNLKTLTNNSGGINGGISNGMPVIFRAVFRPVPSISIPQRSVDPVTDKEVILELRGRHDCCILPRGCAVIEAAAAIAILDQLLDHEVEV